MDFQGKAPLVTSSSKSFMFDENADSSPAETVEVAETIREKSPCLTATADFNTNACRMNNPMDIGSESRSNPGSRSRPKPQSLPIALRDRFKISQVAESLQSTIIS